MREIRGAVQRINVPTKFGTAYVASAFLRSDGVFGII